MTTELAPRMTGFPGLETRRPSGPSDSEQPRRMFSNLLFAAAMTTHSPMAQLAIARRDGTWVAVQYSLNADQIPADGDLWRTIGACSQALEIIDLRLQPQAHFVRLRECSLGIRHIYGMPLRAEGLPLLGVLSVLDHHARQLSSGECRSLSIVAGRLVEQLAMLHRTPGPTPSLQVAGSSEQNRRLASPNPVASFKTAARGNENPSPVMKTAEVAAFFGVTSRTVANWVDHNRLPSTRTPGGYFHFRRDDVMALAVGSGRRSPPSSSPVRRAPDEVCSACGHLLA